MKINTLNILLVSSFIITACNPKSNTSPQLPQNPIPKNEDTQTDGDNNKFTYNGAPPLYFVWHFKNDLISFDVESVGWNQKTKSKNKLDESQIEYFEATKITSNGHNYYVNRNLTVSQKEGHTPKIIKHLQSNQKNGMSEVDSALWESLSEYRKSPPQKVYQDGIDLKKFFMAMKQQRYIDLYRCRSTKLWEKLKQRKIKEAGNPVIYLSGGFPLDIMSKLYHTGFEYNWLKNDVVFLLSGKTAYSEEGVEDLRSFSEPLISGHDRDKESEDLNALKHTSFRTYNWECSIYYEIEYSYYFPEWKLVFYNRETELPYLPKIDSMASRYLKDLIDQKGEDYVTRFGINTYDSLGRSDFEIINKKFINIYFPEDKLWEELNEINNF